jgi:hypothetical protein
VVEADAAIPEASSAAACGGYDEALADAGIATAGAAAAMTPDPTASRLAGSSKTVPRASGSLRSDG